MTSPLNGVLASLLVEIILPAIIPCQSPLFCVKINEMLLSLLLPKSRFQIYLKISLTLLVSNFFFSYFYFLGLNTSKTSVDVFFLPILSLFIFVASLFLITRPHLSQTPKSLILSILGVDYLDRLYQIIRKQIILVSFLLQILISFVNWGSMADAFADPLSFSSYLLWILISAVLVSTFYYVYLLWSEVFRHSMVRK